MELKTPKKGVNDEKTHIHDPRFDTRPYGNSIMRDG
jgi:hypothetical protein